MSQDLANKLPETDSEKLTLILTSVQALRPIWQQVVADILQLQEGQRALSTEVLQLQEGQRALSTEILQLQEGQRALSTEVRADILQLQEGQRALSTEVRAMRRDMDNRFSVMYGMLGEIQMDDRNIHERVSRLELNANPPNSET
jgi:hypothetical protein